MAGPETPFPLSQLIRFADRLYRMPAEQQAHAVAQAKMRLKRKGSHSKRDRAFAELAVTKVGNG